MVYPLHIEVYLEKPSIILRWMSVDITKNYIWVDLLIVKHLLKEHASICASSSSVYCICWLPRSFSSSFCDYSYLINNLRLISHDIYLQLSVSLWGELMEMWWVPLFVLMQSKLKIRSKRGTFSFLVVKSYFCFRYVSMSIYHSLLSNI